MQIRRFTHQVQQVAKLNNGRWRRHHQRFTPFEARADNFIAVDNRYILNRHVVQIGVLNADVDGLKMGVAGTRLLVEALRLFIDVNAKEQAYQPHSEQNAADTKRVGHRVAHTHLVYDAKRLAKIAQNLLPGAQRGSIGYRTGKNAQHDRKWNREDFMQQRGDQAAKNHNQDGKQIQP